MTVESRLHREYGALTTLTNGRHAWHADFDKTFWSSDAAPSPHDLLDSALAACTALTLEIYIRKRGLAVNDLRVAIDRHEDKDEQGRMTYALSRTVYIVGDISDVDREHLLEVAKSCPIHRVLEGEIKVATELI